MGHCDTAALHSVKRGAYSKKVCKRIFSSKSQGTLCCGSLESKHTEMRHIYCVMLSLLVGLLRLGSVLGRLTTKFWKKS